MGADILDFMLSAIVFVIYGAIIMISLIFTFSIETYKKLDYKLNIELFSSSVLNPLAQNLEIVDSWLIDHHKIAGPVLMILALIDLQMWFSIINLAKSLLNT